MIRPDLTHIDTKIWKDGTGTASCATEGRWLQQAIAGDAISLSDDFGPNFPGLNNLQRFIVQGDQLSIVSRVGGREREKEATAYKRVSAGLKP
jgi:hypothetical protein